MGQNLILNGADKGFTVCAFNRTTSKVDRFLEGEAKGEFILYVLFIHMIYMVMYTFIDLNSADTNISFSF